MLAHVAVVRSLGVQPVKGRHAARATTHSMLNPKRCRRFPGECPMNSRCNWRRPCAPCPTGTAQGGKHSTNQAGLAQALCLKHLASAMHACMFNAATQRSQATNCPWGWSWSWGCAAHLHCIVRMACQNHLQNPPCPQRPCAQETGQTPSGFCGKPGISRRLARACTKAGTGKQAADFEEGSLKPCLILKGQTKPAQAPIVASPAAFCRAPPAPAPGRMRAALRCARPRPAGPPSFAGWHALRRPR